MEELKQFLDSWFEDEKSQSGEGGDEDGSI
jgi:hypothetical protein